MIRLYYILLVILSLFISNPAKSQWKPAQFKDSTINVIYTLAQDQSTKKKIRFYFPEYVAYFGYGALNKAYNFGKIESLSRSILPHNNAFASADILIFEKKIPKQPKFKKDTTILGMRIYLENIQSFIITYYRPKEKIFYSKTTIVDHQGFQKPEDSYISQWESLPFVNDKGDDKFDYISIHCQPISANKPFKFLVGQLQLQNVVKKNKIIQDKYFQGIPNLEQDSNTRNYTFFTGTNEFISHPVDGIGMHLIPGSMNISKTNEITNDTEVELLKSLVLKSINSYPFYKERKLSRETVQKDIIKLFSEYRYHKDYCILQDSLSEYIRLRFDDPHFSFIQSSACEIKKKSSLKQAPIRIYEIENRFYIVGVFDKLYKDLKPGLEVFKINAKPINYVLDSISNEAFGRSYRNLSVYKKNTIASSCLNRASTDSCIVEYKDSISNFKNVKLVYNRALQIPDNFKSKSFEIVSKNSIGYLKISSWSSDDMIQIFNNWKELSENKVLIIDLRGNGGGELYPALQLFSLFINRPTNYLKLMNTSGNTQQLILRPNKHYHLKEKKVFILADYLTACTSESFIRAMKTFNEDCRLISSSPTFGTFSFKNTINLPSTAILNTNSIYGRFIYRNPTEQIEYQGINPDYLVKIDNIKDLKVYHDKVLRKAYELASNTNNL